MKQNFVTSVKTTYVLGNGKVSISGGIQLVTEIPFVSLSKLDKANKINTDLMDSDVERK